MQTKILALALAVAAPCAAVADDVRYKYLDIGYQIGGEVEYGFGTSKTDGYALAAAFEVSDDWFIKFDYSSLATDPSIDDIDRHSLALGWHGELFYASLAWKGMEAAGTDGSGYGLELGLRSMVTESLELHGYFSTNDLGDAGKQIAYGGSAVWYFNRSAPDAHRVGLTFNYDLANVADFAGTPGFDVDSTSYGLGLRVDFD